MGAGRKGGSLVAGPPSMGTRVGRVGITSSGEYGLGVRVGSGSPRPESGSAHCMIYEMLQLKRKSEHKNDLFVESHIGEGGKLLSVLPRWPALSAFYDIFIFLYFYSWVYSANDLSAGQ